MKRAGMTLTAVLAAVSLTLSGCESGQNSGIDEETSGEEISSVKETFAMDTYMTLTGYGEQAEDAVDAAISEITRLDALLSAEDPDSEVYRINQNGGGSISPETEELIAMALETGERTGGKFDITILPVMDAWGFTGDTFRVPDEDTLKELLACVDYSQVQLDEEEMKVTLGEEQSMDLGGIAKGFTSDRVMEIFREYGLTSGIVSLGGNVECLGSKTDGSPWRCGIQDPYDSSALLGVLSVKDSAVITSGAYERNFTDEETGETYHHIIDPDTGYPADSGLVSVTIVSSSGILADALSTSMYILGLDGAVQYWEEYGFDFDMVLMTEENQVYVTEGIADSFTSDYDVTAVTR